MIRVKATGFPQFFAAHAALLAAGVEPVASGGNEMRVPDDTDLAVLRTVAATGATVYADLSTAAPPEPSTPPAEKPARKTTPRRRTKET